MNNDLLKGFRRSIFLIMFIGVLYLVISYYYAPESLMKYISYIISVLITLLLLLWVSK